MIALRPALLVLVLVLALAACGGGGGGGDTAPPPPSATLFLSTHVMGTTTRIPGVAVAVQGQSANTNANGEVVFRNLALGTTQVNLTHQSYQPLQIMVNLAAGDNTFSVALTPL